MYQVTGLKLVSSVEFNAGAGFVPLPVRPPIEGVP
jgi:hypothetical protein